jgi:hypothetical protein
VAELPPEFLSVVAEVFGDAAMRTAVEEDRGIRTLLQLWERAQDHERRDVFKFMRDQMEFSEDRERLVLMSWLVGNGTYRTDKSLDKRPWWLKEERDWKAYVADRLDVKSLGPNLWEILTWKGEQVATLSQDEGIYEARYIENPEEIHEVRRFQTWTAAMQDVVARQIMRESVERAENDDVSEPAV